MRRFVVCCYPENSEVGRVEFEVGKKPQLTLEPPWAQVADSINATIERGEGFIGPDRKARLVEGEDEAEIKTLELALKDASNGKLYLAEEVDTLLSASGVSADADLRELFAGHNEYYDKLEAEIADLQALVGDSLTKEELARESGRKRTLLEFEQFWTKVCADPKRKARWLRRFEPGGYEREKAAFDQRVDQRLLQLLHT